MALDPDKMARLDSAVTNLAARFDALCSRADSTGFDEGKHPRGEDGKFGSGGGGSSGSKPKSQSGWNKTSKDLGPYTPGMKIWGGKLHPESPEAEAQVLRTVKEMGKSFNPHDLSRSHNNIYGDVKSKKKILDNLVTKGKLVKFTDKYNIEQYRVPVKKV